MGSIFRILVFVIIVSAGYYVYRHQTGLIRGFEPKNFAQYVRQIPGQIKGVAVELKLPARVIDKAIAILPKNLQDVIPTPSTDSASIDVAKLSQSFSKEIQDLPKNQAKKIVQDVCNQIIKDIDK